PDDEDGAGGNVRGQHRMERVAHRVHDGADRGRDAVERQNVGGGHGDILGERPVAVHADDARVLADVAVAGATLQAVPAHDVPFGGHELTGLQLGDAVAHAHDLAGELVAHDHRRMEPPLGPRIPVRDVQVGAAHPAVAAG